MLTEALVTTSTQRKIMATVYITKELITRVQSVIDKMRRAERANDLPNIDKKYNVDASQLFNIGCWGAADVHLKDLIPKDWMQEMTEADVTVYGTLEDGSNVKTWIRFSGMTMAFQRPSKDYWNKSNSELSIEQVRAMPEEMLGRAELLQRWDDAVMEFTINERWKKVSADITEFLKKCKSLNEAVKLFPNVTMYIDREDMERLNRKVERASQRKLIVESYDTEGLTAAAIAAKLAEAS
jgi:hypothetical protein